MNAQEFMTKMDRITDSFREAHLELARALEATTRAGHQQVLAIDESAAKAEDLQLDLALLKGAPVVVAPVKCQFQPLQENGHRFVMGAGGIFLEVRRPWLHAIQLVAPITDVTTPYGTVTPKLDLAFGRLGVALPQMKEFAAHAMAASPIEAAGAIIWNSRDDTWRIDYPSVIGEATASSIQFEQPQLAEHEHLVIDVHSHGVLGAFFSTVDDADDAGTVKISGVYGNLDRTPTVAFRLCVLGLKIPLTVPAEKIFTE